jgi:hypothetical protein
MSIGSINEKISRIRFTDLDHRPRKVISAVCVDGLVMVKFEDGTFYFSGGKPHEYYYNSRTWAWTDKLLKALRVLKVITTKDIKEHMAQCKKNDMYAEMEVNRESLERLSKKCGFKISNEQKKILKFDERPI